MTNATMPAPAMPVDVPSPATHVIEQPPSGTFPAAGFGVGGFAGGMGGVASLVINVSSAADMFVPWGFRPRERDAQLRAFWPTEGVFASGLSTTISQYVSFGYTLKGPPRTVKYCQDMLQGVQFGRGWSALMTPFLIDLFTQDNGAFLEVVRIDNTDPRSPCVSLNHLDSYRCIRTGDPLEPVWYIDIKGNYHKLKWFNVIAVSEFPSPIEEARGMQYCVLTRMLRSAQIMRDIATVKHEKAAGRFTRQVHLVSGVHKNIIEDAMVQKQQSADAAGLVRFIQPLILASLDPTTKVDVATIDLASVPEDYDDEKALQTYITMMAMAFNGDYQNYAPLPGGGLGSSTQSKVLNMKARGKGPAGFMKMMEQILNFHGIVPRNITFQYGDQDIAQQMEEVELQKGESLVLETLIRSGVVTTQVARQIAVDKGLLDERYLLMMQETNATDEVFGGDSIPVAIVTAADVEPGEPGPTEPPGGATNRPQNSNEERPRAPISNQRRTPGGTPEAGARA